MKFTRLPLMALFASLLLVVMACNLDNSITPIEGDETNLDIHPIPDEPVGPYWVDGSKLTKNDEAVFYKGANTLQTYGLGNPDLMNAWNVQIIREFIGNLREQPIDGNAIQASDGVWYHPLQKIVDQNRANNKITILCPFGWVNNVGQRSLFTGLNPSSQPFYEEYKVKMKTIAEHFKNQPDVWIEVWNEPYHWNNENEYTNDLWLKDMKDMVDNLRWVEGFQNIILVPGNEQGQSENVIIAKGKELLQGRYNLLFDLHAYEKWLLNRSEDELISKIENIKNKDFAFIIGEVGVQNVGELMPVQHFLNAASITNVSVLAWLWNQNSQDNNALLTDDGLPNGTASNNFWGTKYKYLLSK